MHCPKCGEPINITQRFCSNCGVNLDNKSALFNQHKKAVKKQFLGECKNIVGEHDGCSKLGQAAWFIATNTPNNFELLQGNLMGDAASYDALDFAVDEARKLAEMFAEVRRIYNACPNGFFYLCGGGEATICYGKDAKAWLP